MVAAYVDGRPIPLSSNAFTKVASVKRGGGLVSWPSAPTDRVSTGSPAASCGSRRSSSRASSAAARSSSRPSSYAARKPRKVMTVPDADSSTSRPSSSVAASRTVAVEPEASAICEATVRFQISS